MDLLTFLKEKNLIIAAAESCTGGLIAKLITDSGGASQFFEMGVVTYSNEAKQKLLGVSLETLEKHGAVSAETASEMAEGILRLSGADIAVSVTGIAGPSGGTLQKPVGLVYVGISGKYGTKVEKLNLSGTRDDIRSNTASKALQIAYQYIVQNYN